MAAQDFGAVLRIFFLGGKIPAEVRLRRHDRPHARPNLKYSAVEFLPAGRPCGRVGRRGWGLRERGDCEEGLGDGRSGESRGASVRDGIRF